MLSIIITNTSCQKVICPNAIYGYWSLQNKVHFTKDALTHLEFHDSLDGWGDPVINDTIYHYVKVNVAGDQLLLEDENGKVHSYFIEELHDSILVVSDFPGVTGNSNLEFKKIMEVQDGHKSRFKRFDVSLLPSDSLDINMKSPLYYKYNEGALVLTKDKVVIARGLLENFMSKLKTSDTEYNLPFEFSKYLRYYAGFINESGEECAYVCLDRLGYYRGCFPYSYFKQYIPSVKDGGKEHVHAIVNLEKKLVSDFYFIDISGIYRFTEPVN